MFLSVIENWVNITGTNMQYFDRNHKISTNSWSFCFFHEFGSVNPSVNKIIISIVLMEYRIWAKWGVNLVKKYHQLLKGITNSKCLYYQWRYSSASRSNLSRSQYGIINRGHPFYLVKCFYSKYEFSKAWILCSARKIDSR